MQCLNPNKKGFSLIELLVVMFIIIILSVIGLQSYIAHSVKQRDNERKTKLQSFAALLERYRSEKGVYPCGTGGPTKCAYTVPGDVDQLYEIACSDGVTGEANSYGNDPTEIGIFLNGGQCCTSLERNDPPITYNSYPDATTTGPVACVPINPGGGASLGFSSGDGRICDDSAWGLYRWGFSKDTNPKDPLNSVVNGKAYYYCYAVTGAGRQEYALFARMEDNALNKLDGGKKDTWYEVYSPGYNRTKGWVPWLSNNPAWSS